MNHHVNNVTGWYPSNKGGSIRYDSSLEFRRLKALDFDASVRFFKRCDDKIPWTDANGVEHFYNPDFDIEYMDGTRVVEEMKGIVTDDAKRKIAAAKEFYSSICLYRVLYTQDAEEDLEYFVSYYENSLGVKCRPRIESTFMRTTVAFSKYSTCNRLAVGAMFVDPRSEQVLCFGYNGTWAGGPNDCDSLEPGKCGCIHAEVNAITKATQTLEGSTLYVTTAPCFTCSKLLINRRIARVFYLKAYRDVSGIRLLRENGIEVTRYNDLVDFSSLVAEETVSCSCGDANCSS
jgi:dCMP deaminase